MKRIRITENIEYIQPDETVCHITSAGIYFKNKANLNEPLKSIMTIQDEIAFEHHRKVLEEGSLEKFFTELKGV